jgi:hypothetical protein
MSADVYVGSNTGLATCTGTIFYDGGLNFLNLDTFSFTGANGSAASCALLSSAEYRPLENKYIPVMTSMNGTKNVGMIKIGTDGILTFYSAVSGTGWTAAQTGIVYACTLKYDSH